MNLMLLLEMAADAHGDRTALTTDDADLTYADLFARVGAAAPTFRAADVDHVVYLDVTGPALPVAVFASAWAGIPFVPLNYRRTQAEIDALLAELDPALVVDADRGRALTAAPDAPAGERDWSMDPERVAILLYTSGTTGAPKAAIVRHRHLVSYVLGTIEFGSAGDDECALVAVPPYHIAGMTALCTSVYAGRRMVQLADFDPDAWIDLARREAVTHAMVVPTMLARIVDRLARRDDGGIPSLRVVAYGGGRMPRPVIERALALFPDTDFSNAYGLTETSSTVAVLGPDEHRAGRHLGSVGRPLPTLEVTVRDQHGGEVGAGQTGEIWVRGEQVSGEYVGRPTRTDADGWFHTNDGGRFDAEGYLYVEGRLDDVIVRGGENISPGEIEDVVARHPAVADVAAVGCPDEEWGEAIGLAVVPTDASRPPTLDDLADHVVAELRSSRRPDRLLVRDELPYNETGKLLRRVLREEFDA